MKLALFIVALSAFATNAAVAEPTAKDALDHYDSADRYGKETVETLVMATASGISWANVDIGGPDQSRQKLYCPPPKLAFSSSQLVLMVRSEVDLKPELAEKPLGVALLHAFKDNFPCDHPLNR